MPPKRRAPAAKRPKKAASKSNRPHAATDAIAAIPLEPTANLNPATKPLVTRHKPLTNVAKALKFRSQVEKAKKAVARELHPCSSTLPPPGDYDEDVADQERRTGLRARRYNVGGRVGRGKPLTNEQKRTFLLKQMKGRAEKERMAGLVTGGSGGAGDGRVGAWIKDVPYPGSIEEAREKWKKLGEDGGGGLMRCDARAKGPGVETVLKSQGGDFLPVRWEKRA